jgi:hypothetical protein
MVLCGCEDRSQTGETRGTLIKNNRVTERINLQFRAEAFNLFSSHYYTPVFPKNSFTATNLSDLHPSTGPVRNMNLQASESTGRPDLILLVETAEKWAATKCFVTKAC